MGYASWQAWIVLFWAAIGPSAMASVLQAKGQQLLGPAQAQVRQIYLSLLATITVGMSTL